VHRNIHASTKRSVKLCHHSSQIVNYTSVYQFIFDF